ncbi:unnamed protein product [Rhizoctonia solani]|uniref:Uncharacterized protein n=1 Tax=Rhizoctonia solani TaxID=456999 RepID=A0A8H3E825_9AGAM|nr:unnamed protein product [Rhizoctonia solani]CAE7172928.1 unnamed protein product [Rhizoctonia solani]
MFRFAHAIVALLAATPLLAQRLRDGQYKVSYSPAPCGIETKHYLDLSAPTAEATFNPIAEAQAQVWEVSTSATDSTWRELRSTTYPGISLGYPTAKDGTRVRGIDETSDDFYWFNLVSSGKPGYYYVYPYTSRDFVLNGDTRTEPGNRFGYFRGNVTDDKFPLQMLPLYFAPVTTASVDASANA